MEIIPKGLDGYYHPSREEELRALVVYAYENRRSLRVRGSAHSTPPAIFSTGYSGEGPPPAGDVEVMLDQYRAVRITPDARDPRKATVEVEAGCNLGKDPYDPTGTSTWKNSLNYQLQRAGYALDDLGGITHQTISGFMSTGSSGGSLAYSFHENLARIRFIDGTGAIHDVSRDDPDPDKRALFFAAGVSMGLFGVISKVWLRVGPTYNIFGSQVTASTDDLPFDMFGPGGPKKPGIVEFLKKTPYSRLMWWPQHDFERVQVWQAARLETMSDFHDQPYIEIDGRLQALAGSLVYTLLGNLDDISAVPPKLTYWYAALEADIDGDPDPNACPALQPARRGKVRVTDVMDFIRTRLARSIAKGKRGAAPAGMAAKLRGTSGDWIASIITRLVECALNGWLHTPFAQLLANQLKKVLPTIIPYVLGVFVTDGTQTFWDTWMCALPMDNQMDDKLWPTDFTELWIPLEKAPEALGVLRDYYLAGGDKQKSFEHTGAFSCELYAANASPFWMSPSYERDVFRVDVFWFGLNAGDPSQSFYPPFWELLKPFSFRPHWGKDLPPASAEWQQYYRQSFPKLDEFLRLRRTFDPRGIFLTDYWRDHLGVTNDA